MRKQSEGASAPSIGVFDSGGRMPPSLTSFDSPRWIALPQGRQRDEESG
ncbi:MAG: hypothetical protein ORO03_07135 [Alphaproteobacteria bacterium]|nr:hypothetical protein [Alphaproteobacteria bacterium]